MKLRDQVLRGGAYLSLRQGVGMLVSFAGVLLLARAIGPEAYGLYAAALNLCTYFLGLSQWGVGPYLVRREGETEAEDYQQAFSLLLLLGVGTSLLAMLSLHAFGSWLRLEGFVPVATSLFVALPLNLSTVPPLAYLERGLDYRKIALVELSGQVTYYLVALPLAYSGLGVWAPVLGWWSQLLLTLGVLHRVARYRPRWYWERARVRSMLNYGLGFSASMWVWQLRSLVNPLVVGRYLGAEAVGYVNLAVRLVEYLGFVKAATWRLSIAALAKLQDGRAQLAKAITEGMHLQVLAVGPLLLGFALLGPWLLPALFGPRWIPAMELFPFLAAGYLANAVFNMQSSALYVLRRNWDVTIFHLAHIVLFAGAAWLLVTRLGLMGYAWAEIVALLSYGVIHMQTAKHVGRPKYSMAGIWAFAFAISFFWRALGVIAFLPLLGVFLSSHSRRVLHSYWLTIWTGLLRREV